MPLVPPTCNHSTLSPTYRLTHLVGDLHAGTSRTAIILVLPPTGIHVKVGGNRGTSVKGHFPNLPPSISLLSFSSVRDLFRVLSYKIKQNWKVNLLGGEKKNSMTSIQYISTPNRNG